MITILAVTSLFLNAAAIPVSFGPITPPSIARDVLFGRQVQCDCTGVMQRTLFDIVRSCLFTIAACVYRAIHQNIPDPKATWGQRMWVRIKITILALFAPEMMIWWAMKQWMAARMIRDQVNRKYPELEWTLTHGYFLQMGGFVNKDDGRVILLSELLEHLDDFRIRIDALRKISKKEIDDHSKGDFLSKALVTLQTTWFVIECITRWQQKLLLTELEVATLAFAILNMFTYAFWWQKPLDVLCPIKLDTEPIRTTQPPTHTEQQPTTQTSSGDQQDVTSGQNLGQTRSLLVAPPVPATAENHVPKFDLNIRRKITAILSSLSSTGQGVLNAFCAWGSDISMAFRDRGWWSATVRAIVTPFFYFLRWLKELFEQTSIRDDATHVPTFYTGEVEEEKWGLVFSLCCFIGMIFGAIHFLSWNSQFPTHTASLLWKISSIVLVAQPFLIAILQVLMPHSRNIPDSILVSLVFIPSIIGPIAYVLARGCLLTLAFLSLHNLPPPAFESVSWTAYIPHL